MTGLCIIGVDPASSKQGIAVVNTDGCIDRKFTRALGKTSARECHIILAQIMAEYEDHRKIVSIEEWSVAAGFFSGKSGKKETNWTTVKSLERSGHNWFAAAEILGLEASRINSSTWHAAYKVLSHQKKAQALGAPTTKQQSQNTVKLVFGMTVSEDVADAILIANYVYSTEKFRAR